MITYNKTELSKKELYEDFDGTILAFKGYRNEQIAIFSLCNYNEKKGDFIKTNKIVYLTSREVKHLKTI